DDARGDRVGVDDPIDPVQDSPAVAGSDVSVTKGGLDTDLPIFGIPKKLAVVNQFQAVLRIIVVIFGRGVVGRRGAFHDQALALNLAATSIAPVPGLPAGIAGDIHLVVRTVVIGTIDSGSGGGSRIADGSEAAEFFEIDTNVQPHPVTEADFVQPGGGVGFEIERRGRIAIAESLPPCQRGSQQGQRTNRAFQSDDGHRWSYGAVYGRTISR